jgi:hypothetical protein
MKMVAFQNQSRAAQKLIDLKVAHREGSQLPHLREAWWRKREQQLLAKAAGIADRRLLDRLVSAGFNADNVVALRFAPVAEVAWASGRITDAERLLAVKPVFSDDLFGKAAAVAKFKSWLSRRPSSKLSELWQDYTLHRLGSSEGASERRFGRRLYQLARKVAMASGGLLNLGEICPMERQVLRRVERVYGLSQT